MKTVTVRQSEKIVQQHIVHLLRSIGATVYVLGTHRRKGDHQGTMQTPGLPDIYMILPVPMQTDRALTVGSLVRYRLVAGGVSRMQGAA